MPTKSMPKCSRIVFCKERTFHVNTASPVCSEWIRMSFYHATPCWLPPRKTCSDIVSTPSRWYPCGERITTDNRIKGWSGTSDLLTAPSTGRCAAHGRSSRRRLQAFPIDMHLRHSSRRAAARSLVSKAAERIGVLTVWNGLSSVCCAQYGLGVERSDKADSALRICTRAAV